VLAKRRDVDDAGRLSEHHERQQQPGEQEPGKIVDSETKLVAVLTSLSAPGGAARADSGVVDENVEPVTFLAARSKSAFRAIT
jgi:hypothetical protein